MAGVVALLAGALLAGALVAASPLTAIGDSATPLGTTSFGRIVVDAADSHVFVSSPADGSIVVLDYGGGIVKTITGEAGADSMVVQGGTLYVALTAAGEIDRISTSTLTETSPLVSGLVHPADLAYAGGKLWTTSGSCNQWSVVLASVDPSATSPAVTTYPSAFDVTNGLSYCAAFATNSSAPDTLLAWDRLDPANLTAFDVSGGSPVQVGTQREEILQNLEDVALNPDGTHLITASGSPYEIDQWTVATLAQDGSYPATNYPTAVATAAGNGGMMAGGINGIYTNDVYVYRIGHPEAAFRVVDFGSTGNTTLPRGMAFSPDGLRLFVVSGGTGGGPLFNLIDVPTAAPSPSPSPTATPTPSPTPTPSASPSPTPSPTPTPSPGAPGPPLAVSAVAGIGSATVTWNPPTDPGSSAISSYTISSSGGATLTVPASARASVITNGGGGPEGTIAGLSATPHTFTVTATNATGTGPASAPSNQVTPFEGGTYHALQPRRLLDTRDGTGGVPAGPLRSGQTLDLPVGGNGGVPADGHVSGVVLNVTVTDTAGPGYVTVFPAGGALPLASNLNYAAGETVPNLVTVALPANGRISFYVQGGAADLVADVEGWIGDSTNSFSRYGMFNAITPRRMLDTRDGTGTGGVVARLGPDQSMDVNITGPGSPPGYGFSAVVLNVTVTDPSLAGYLTVYPAGTSRPLASNLNFSGGETVANRVVAGLGGSDVTIYNAAGTVDVIVDWDGYFTDSFAGGGAGLVSTDPYRLVDTRDGLGPIGPGYVLDLPIQSQMPLSALALNVTATDPTSPSYLTVYPDDGSHGYGAPPLASDVNFGANQTVPNLTVVGTGADGAFDVFNASGWVDVVIDVSGYYGGVAPAPPYGLQPRASIRAEPAASPGHGATRTAGLVRSVDPARHPGPVGLPELAF